MEDIKTILKEYNEDIKRHIDVLKGDFDGNIKLLGESVAGIQQQLVALREMVVRNTEDIEIIKTDTQFIKNDLKQKVSQERI